MKTTVPTTNPCVTIVAEQSKKTKDRPVYAIADVLGAEILTSVHFQFGPVIENGVNGCQIEDLLAICLHRLQGFQAGEFPCRENALAITKIEEAVHRLNDRTGDRVARGVEGKSEK